MINYREYTRMKNKTDILSDDIRALFDNIKDRDVEYESHMEEYDRLDEMSFTDAMKYIFSTGKLPAIQSIKEFALAGSLLELDSIDLKEIDTIIKEKDKIIADMETFINQLKND